MNDSFETAFILLKERKKIIRKTTTQEVNTIELLVYTAVSPYLWPTNTVVLPA